MDDRIAAGRNFLRSNWRLLEDGSFTSDRAKGVAPPAIQEAPAEGAFRAALPPPETAPLRQGTIRELLASRKSRRKFDREASLALGDLGFLLWACEGVRSHTELYSMRTAPSGGARHPFELYAFVRRVEGMGRGLYRYLGIGHELVLERAEFEDGALDSALLGQLWDAPVVLVWAAVPYRTEWKYGPVSHKIVAIDAGHSCENLYLACEGLGLGTCGIGAYDQESLDALLGLDGADRFACYAAPVGRPLA